MNMEPILQVSGLSKHYPAFSLRDVTFTVEPGTVMGFVGKNGAGKSTTLKSLLGLVHPDAGEVQICGQDYFSHMATLKTQLGVVLGGIDFYPRKKLKDIAQVTRRFYSDSWQEETYRHYCRLFELDENKNAAELSSGMRVKFLLALALSHDARLLILDEPTSGLDPVARDELCRLFAGLVQNGKRSVLFSTHITSDLEKCATHITLIRNGQIEASLPKDAFPAAFAGQHGLGDTPTLEEILVALERREYDASQLAL